MTSDSASTFSETLEQPCRRSTKTIETLADPGAVTQGFVEGLDEERVPVGDQPVERDAAERLPPPAAEAAGAVGDRRARDRPHVAVGRHAERDAVERPVHDVDAVQVAGADHHVERLGRRNQRRQVRGAVRQVGVHLTDEVGVAREHAPEPVDVGPAEAPAPAAVQDVHPPRMLAREGVGHRAGAVGRVVVDDEHAVVALPEHVRDQHGEVVALVVGGDHDGDVHAPCDSSWKARQVVERWFLRVMLGVSVVAWSLLLLAELGWFRLGLVAFLVAVTIIGFGLWGVFRTVPPAPAHGRRRAAAGAGGGGRDPAVRRAVPPAVHAPRWPPATPTVYLN